MRQDRDGRLYIESLRDIYAAMESQRAAKEPPVPSATALRHHDMSWLQAIGRSCSRDPCRASPEDPFITNKSDVATVMPSGTVPEQLSSCMGYSPLCIRRALTIAVIEIFAVSRAMAQSSPQPFQPTPPSRTSATGFS